MKKVIDLIRKNKIVLIIILIISGWFYWFQLRPEIKLKKCLNTAFEKAHENWVMSCRKLDREDNCSLPSSKADDIKESLKYYQGLCGTVWNK